MMIRALSLVAVLLLVANSADALKVKNVVISDPTEQRKDITEDVVVRKQSEDEILENHVTVTDVKRQKFEGIGGSFMRAGAHVLNQMPEDKQEAILDDLFNQDTGARFTVGKVPIGPTDFGGPNWYSYAEEEQDVSLPLFSIEKDLEPEHGFIPYVKRASEVIGKNVRLEATLDYAPHWMLNATTPLPEPDLNSTYLAHLATYYLKYSQAMADNGAPIEYLSMFNEVLDSYMYTSYQNIRDLLVDHVGPLFRNTPGAPKLTWSALPGRHASAEGSPELYQMDGVQDFIDIIFYHGYDCNDGPAEGLGWQCTDEAGTPKTGMNTTCPFLDRSSGAMKGFLEKYGGERQVWMTELCYASEFDDYNPALTGCPDIPRYDFNDATQWAKMMYADFNIIEANAWIYWNMVLDTTGGPWLISPKHNDPVKNPQQPVIIADPKTGEYWKTGCYYAMWHFGRQNVGSHRVEVKPSEELYPTLYHVAFKEEPEEGSDGDQVVTVVLMNDDVVTRTMTVSFGEAEDEYISVVLPSVSIATVTVTL
jgi:O-glycosyl hydrolase